MLEQGRVRTPDLATLAVEIPEPSGPFGMKGAGEIGIDGPLPAMANALAEAIRKRIFQSPAPVSGSLRQRGSEWTLKFAHSCCIGTLDTGEKGRNGL